MKYTLSRKLIALGIAASMTSSVGIAKPKDKEDPAGKGKPPAADVAKQAEKAEKQTENAPIQTVRSKEAGKQAKPKKSDPTQKKVTAQPPQRGNAERTKNQAKQVPPAAAPAESRGKAMTRQDAVQAGEQRVAKKTKEVKQRPEAAQADARERVESMKEPSGKGRESKGATTANERAVAAQANARERARLMEGKTSEKVEKAPKKAEESTGRVAEAAKNRGETMRPENAERGKGSVADARERLERAKERKNMPEGANSLAPEENAPDKANREKTRGEKMSESGLSKNEKAEDSGRVKMADRDTADSDKSKEMADKPKVTATTSAEGAARTKGRANNAEAEAEAQERTERRQQAGENRTEQTAQVLQDRRHRGDRDDFRRRARNFNDDDDALELIAATLGGVAIGAVAADLLDNHDDHYRRGRLPLDQVGRTRYERETTVDFLVRRFQGRATYADAPRWFDSPYWDGRGSGDRYHHHQPHFYNNNVRVVRYSSYNAVPPVLLGYDRLNRVNVASWNESPYYEAEQPDYYRNLPEAYRSEQSYAVSYPVDPDSAVTEDNILFEQGTSTLADAYSYDLIVDIAEALSSSELQNERFVIEGHASAEGGFESNQQLSQARAERIAGDLVELGVSADRIIPVGYGESEAQYPADAPESQRELDRRVMVFRLKE